MRTIINNIHYEDKTSLITAEIDKIIEDTQNVSKWEIIERLELLKDLIKEVDYI